MAFLLRKVVDSSHFEIVLDRVVSSVDIITKLQALSLFCDYGLVGTDKYEFILKDVERIFSEFNEKKGPNMQTSKYPELIAVLHALWLKTHNKIWKEKALIVSDWYIKTQKEDGAFPRSSESSFSYSRGTGKIFETLACFPKENHQSLVKAFIWLSSMQYTEDNLYWTPGQILEGGIRHDAFNREAWIDASAHFVLGTARWLNNQIRTIDK